MLEGHASCRCRSTRAGCGGAATTRRPLIAEALARRTGLEVADCLGARRVGRHPGRPRPRASAALGPAGSIELRAAAPGRVVLVDDVVTTGATLAACAAVLRAAGSIEVAALVFARTIGR